MKKEIICINCGKTFVIHRKKRIKNAKFCSFECKSQYSKIQLECFNCEKTFERNKGIIKSRKAEKYFCSFECRIQYNKKFGTWNKGLNLVEVTCDWCGNKIIKPFSILKQYKNHFCCKICYNQWMSKNQVGERNPSWKQKEVVCDYCKESFLSPPSKIRRYDHFFCSNKCKYHWMSKNLSGENNHNWVGGTINSRGSNWQIQKEKALKRDDYTCQRCGNTENLVVHHIIPFRFFGLENYKLANQLKNLITCCNSCHGKLEFESRMLLKEVISVGLP